MSLEAKKLVSILAASTQVTGTREETVESTKAIETIETIETAEVVKTAKAVGTARINKDGEESESKYPKNLA